MHVSHDLLFREKGDKCSERKAHISEVLCLIDMSTDRTYKNSLYDIFVLYLENNDSEE